MRVKCPTCNKETDYGGNPYRPFCCERCKTADMASWADGAYRIPDASKGGSLHDQINRLEEA